MANDAKVGGCEGGLVGTSEIELQGNVGEHREEIGVV